MKMIESMKLWLEAWTTARKEKTAKKRKLALARESEVVIQAREFNGEVYLCVNNEPIVPADGLSWDLPTALTVARDSWFKWKEKEARYERH